MKLTLPDVTLVTVDCAAHALTKMALEDCLDRADFGGVQVYSDKNILPGAEWHYLEVNGTKEATGAYWYEVPRHVTTSHILYIQYDSWIVNAGAWEPEFLNYDYIGAPWWYQDDCNVGNGGFSLRSTHLMKFLMNWPQEYPCYRPEDDALCRRYGPKLKERGFKFAPMDTAIKFSFERVRGQDAEGHWIPTFGFHGPFNWPLVLTDEQIEERLKVAAPFFFNHPHYTQLREAMAKRASPWE